MEIPVPMLLEQIQALQEEVAKLKNMVTDTVTALVFLKNTTIYIYIYLSIYTINTYDLCRAIVLHCFQESQSGAGWCC